MLSISSSRRVHAVHLCDHPIGQPIARLEHELPIHAVQLGIDGHVGGDGGTALVGVELEIN